MLHTRLTAARSRLREIATGGSASVAVSVGATNLLRIISTMTLTRLLDSHAYGVVGLILSISYVVTMLSDVGLYNFIIRHKEGEDEKFLNEIWTIRMMRGVGLAVLMVVLAEPFALLVQKPEIAGALAVWSISFVLDGFSSLAFALGVRNHQFWRLSLLDLSYNVATFMMSIVMALVLRSYWALIIGMVLGGMVKLVLSYVLFPHSRRAIRFSMARSRELWGFSRYIAMSSFLSVLILQTDKVVLARLMPLAEFGLYSIATTLSVAPAAISGMYANRVLLAAYSKAQRKEPERLRHVFYEKRRNILLLYMFALAGIVTGAPLIVEVLYDDRYRGVTPFLQWLVISPMLRLMVLSSNQVLLSVGQTRSTLTANVFRITWLAIGAGAGLWMHNIMLLVAAVGTVEVPGLLCFWFNLHRVKLLDLRQEALGFIAAGAGLGVGWAVNAAGMALIG
ncbi:MAG: oligosaccharide flippase family protein [Novosphingobium sp.]|nr:oligosaccharide flippase family protein [Novosphingobium sp.]